MFRSAKKAAKPSPGSTTDAKGLTKKAANQVDTYGNKFLEKENENQSGMLVATPIRVAMVAHLNKQNYNINNNNNTIDNTSQNSDNHVVLKSARSSRGSGECLDASATQSCSHSNVSSGTTFTSPSHSNPQGAVFLRSKSSASAFTKRVDGEGIVLRSELSPSTSKIIGTKQEDTSASANQTSSSKRSSDSIKRRSGYQHPHRKVNSAEYSKKRNSDPISINALVASMASLKVLFSGVGHQSGCRKEVECLSFKQQSTPKTPLKGKTKTPAKIASTNRDRTSASKTTFYTDASPTVESDSLREAKVSTAASLKSTKTTSSQIGKSFRKKLFHGNSASKVDKNYGKKDHKWTTSTTKEHNILASSASKNHKNSASCAAKDHSNSGSVTTKDNPNVNIVSQVEGASEKKWGARSNSLRRQFHRTTRDNGGHLQHHHMHDPSVHSDTEIGKISAPHSLLDGECGSVTGSVTSERGIDVGRVAAWATSFEKLLEDPAGLHTFAEFLKKEYSHENIYFWTACERYKRLSSPDELQALAKVIFERHLCIGASEPVNVDSQARQDAQDSLPDPNEFLFAQAQKQIFNLMKFDSYSRFLKSSLYQDCLSRDMRGLTLPYPGDDSLDPDLKIIHDQNHVTLKKSKSDADERRRKSLLPWNRKDRSKSKDRGEAEYRRQKKGHLTGSHHLGHRNQSDTSSIRSDMSGSRTSLNSADMMIGGRRAISKESLTSGELGSLSGSEGYNRCRVVLPDLSNSVVAVRHGESVQELLTRLLERRVISYSTFDVYNNKTDKLLDKTEESTSLGGLEVRIEQRILFRLDLPNRKTVCVKAKPNKLTCEVLKPILHKYGYKLDLMSIHKVGEEKGVNLKSPVNEIDGNRLVVQTKEEVKEWGVEPARLKKRGCGTSLDEITNKVFNDIRNGKSEENFDELGVLDFDARSSRTDPGSSDTSSGVTGGFSLRNSIPTDKDMISNKVRKPPNRASVHDGMGVRGGMLMGSSDHHPLITKRRGNNNNNSNPPANAKQENDELYEGLKRAQRSRLDDQRGTEINFELPDFLKCHQPEDKENQHHAHLLAHLECSFTDGGVIPSHQEAEDYFSMAHPEVWGGLPASPQSANATLLAPPDLDLDEFDNTLIGGEESPGEVPLPETASSTSWLHLDPPDFSPPPPISMDSSGNLPPPPVSRIIPPSLNLSPPPPPLPPKPKIGGIRGPPPRPPSRHLLNPPTFSSTSDEDALHVSDPPVHMSRQSHDTFNISFV